MVKTSFFPLDCLYGKLFLSVHTVFLRDTPSQSRIWFNETYLYMHILPWSVLYRDVWGSTVLKMRLHYV